MSDHVLLFTDTFRSLLRPSSGYQARIQTIYVGESNENFKYFLSRNLSNTKGTQ